ncbi:TPA: YceI family protein [Candidatus Woesearchaeota archaeon]|nr:YceI family protein [Candidatus Woesearchaeota archaeon]
MKLPYMTLLILVFAVAACTAPPDDLPRAQTTGATGDVVDSSDTVPIDPAKSSFTFTGYGPGKSHVGTFTDLSGELLLVGDSVVGARGVIQATSVKTDGERLENHLRSADFFDVATYPEITMESTSIVDGTLRGTLTFHGVTKEISFPVTTGPRTLSADTVISMKAFGVEYTGVNDEVRIQFSLSA